MTRDVDIERLLETWLQEGPSEIPDRAITAVADRIERQPQRGRWRLRLIDGEGRGRLRLLVAAAAILLAVAGAAVIGRLSAPTIGGPSPSPSVTPSQTPATSRIYSSAKFGITYELPVGWVNAREGEFWFLLSPFDGQESLEGISVFRDGVIADQDAGCSQTPKPGLGHGVDDFVTYLTGHPGLVTTQPAPVSIGGKTAISLDLSVAPSWTQTCPFNGIATVMYLTGEGGAHYLWGADTFEHQRMAFLDDGDGGALVVAINARSAAAFDELVRTATPTLESLAIDTRARPTPTAVSSGSPSP